MIAAAGTVLLDLADVADGGSRAFTLGEGEWPLRGMLIRDGDAVQAYVNRCPHAGHQLNFMSDNFLTPDRQLIICRSHDAMFDKASGVCVAGPCPGESLTRIAIVIESGKVKLAADVDIDALATRYW
ncbi:MAG: Rieske 2Fe-2S domain-containing protein [Pseudomonadota bacterium]